MSKTITTTLEKICLQEKGAIISGPFGSNISSRFFVTEGIPVIRGNNLSLSYDKFYDSGFVFVTKEKADELKCYAYRDDLIFTAAGTIGQVGIIPRNSLYEEYVISNKQIRARIDTRKVDLLYAYYWFSSPWIREILLRSNKGSTVPLLTLNEVKELPIVYPESLSEQRKIANCIELISSKIEVNRKINDNLQQQLKLMYDYWFTQFDFPDENGKPYRSSGGAMVWNEQLKRNIPVNWKADNLYAVADYVNGLACQNYRPDDDNQKLPVIKITEMHNGITDSTEFVRDDIPEKYIIENGDILFSWSATLETMLWYGGRGGLNQHIFKVVPKAPKYFAYSQLSSYIINFKAIAEARKTTMGHITTDHMEQSRIAIPPTIVQDAFNRQVTPLYEQIANNCKESLRLQALRDWLLPMLMNGQATIAD